MGFRNASAYERLKVWRPASLRGSLAPPSGASASLRSSGASASLRSSGASASASAKKPAATSSNGVKKKKSTLYSRTMQLPLGAAWNPNFCPGNAGKADWEQGFAWARNGDTAEKIMSSMPGVSSLGDIVTYNSFTPGFSAKAKLKAGTIVAITAAGRALIESRPQMSTAGASGAMNGAMNGACEAGDSGAWNPTIYNNNSIQDFVAFKGRKHYFIRSSNSRKAAKRARRTQTKSQWTNERVSNSRLLN